MNYCSNYSVLAQQYLLILMVKVAVEPGRTVTEGQTLIILEAMKMENDLRAPRDGVVHEVRVAAGAQVALGQLLVTLR